MRRRFHHFTFYGFLLCFAATVVATGYHYFAGIEAPYPFFSVPVCWALGGIGLLVGPAGLLWLNLALAAARRRTAKTDGSRFILLLLLTSSPASPCWRDETPRGWAFCSPFTSAWSWRCF
jgi:citrate/tricarballylate utilization protein